MRCRITHTGKNHSACFSAWRRAPFVADDRSNLYAEKKQLEMLTYRNEDKRGTRRAGLPIAQLLPDHGAGAIRRCITDRNFVLWRIIVEDYNHFTV